MGTVTAEVTIDFGEFEMIREFDPDPDTSYMDQDEFRDARASYHAGEFSFIVIRAMCEVRVNNSPFPERIVSPGLWSVCDNSDDDYIREIYSDECETLRAMLADQFGSIVPGEPCLACGAPIPPWDDPASHDAGCPLA